jgi:hypothetical protein
MRIGGLCCITAVMAQDSLGVQGNRSLLSARGLAAGRRLAEAKCETAAWPLSYGKKGDYATAKFTCTTAKPAVLISNKASGGDHATVDQTEANVVTDCCKTAVKCSSTYVGHGVTAGAGQTACASSGNIVPATLDCFSIDSADNTKCGNLVAANSATIDKAHCCRQNCNDATGGFELGSASTVKPDCPSTGGDYQIHTTAFCAGTACASSDQATCCQKKCTSGFVLFGVTKVTASGNDQNCATGADQVHKTAYCAGSTCASTDAGTCCQNKCADGYELFGGTTSGKRQCAKDLRVSPDNHCSGPTCASSDDDTCCETKCDSTGATSKGFELHGGTTTGMQQCAKDLKVHKTAYCTSKACTSNSGVCCQQKCVKGFKLKGASTAESNECGEGLTVHKTAYCKGSSCASSDAGTCCQAKCSKQFKAHGVVDEKKAQTCAEKSTVSSDGKCVGSPCKESDSDICCDMPCTDKKLGWKADGASSKEPNVCKKKEKVAEKGFCKGKCGSSDDENCCMKPNNSSGSSPGQTTDANSAGLAAGVLGMMIVLSTAA